MGKRFVEELFDDLDGSTPATSVSFGLNGVVYDIDLSEGNQQVLQQALAPFLHVARIRHPGDQVHEVVQGPEPELVPEPDPVKTTTDAPAKEETGANQELTILESLAGPQGDIQAITEDISHDYDQAAQVLSRLDRADFLSWADANGYRIVAAERVAPPVLAAYLSARHLSAQGESIEDIKRRTTPAQVRRWAAEHGRDISDRGRIPVAAWLDYASDTKTDHDLADTGSKVHERAVGSAQELAKLRRKYTVIQVRAWAKMQGLPVPGLNSPTPPELFFAFDRARRSPDVPQFTWRAKSSTSRARREPKQAQRQNRVSEVVASKELPAPTIEPKVAKKRNHDRVYPQGIREWARSQGYVVGRASIAPEVLEAFAAAHPQEH